METALWEVLDNDGYVWAICIALFIVAERLYPRFPAQRLLRRESGQNFAWLLLNEVLNRTWARVAAAVALLRLANLGPFIRGYLPALDRIAGWPVWLQFVAILLIADFLAWALHYFVHRNRFLSKFHVLHHSSESLDWLAAFRGHWIDSTFLDLSMTLPLAILPVGNHLMLVFGFAGVFWTCFIHSNTRVGALFGWIVSPASHHWHHSATNHIPHGQNFGTYTLVWDRLFGTLYLPADAKAPTRFGLFRPEKYARSFTRRLFGPFLPGAYALVGKRRIGIVH
jgi:sterol desaturase/sphingolipid hydroxylase (fatty acid hydroxylase superfamily)